jgi:hypothetical protein
MLSDSNEQKGKKKSYRQIQGNCDCNCDRSCILTSLAVWYLEILRHLAFFKAERKSADD